jgi:hypothetical protein
MNNENMPELPKSFGYFKNKETCFTVDAVTYGQACYNAGRDAERARQAAIAQPSGAAIDYASDFVKFAIDEAEKRGLDYVLVRILRAIMAKHAAAPQPPVSALEFTRDYRLGYRNGWNDGRNQVLENASSRTTKEG